MCIHTPGKHCIDFLSQPGSPFLPHHLLLSLTHRQIQLHTFTQRTNKGLPIRTQNYSNIYIVSCSLKPLPRAVQALPFTIWLENKLAKHANIRGKDGEENTCLQPGCSSDADFLKTGPRLFTARLHTKSPLSD